MTYLEQKKRVLKQSSYEALETTVNLITDHIGRKKLKEFNNEKLQALINKLYDHDYSRSTLMKVNASVAAMLRMAAANEQIPKIPVLNINIPNPKTQEEILENDTKSNCLTVAEMAAYEEEVKRTKRITNKYIPSYGKTLLIHTNGWKLSLLLHTGLRQWRYMPIWIWWIPRTQTEVRTT